MATDAYSIDIEAATHANTDFWRVLYTVPNALQVVLMSVAPEDGEIGVEAHAETQLFRVESGSGYATLADARLIALHPGAMLVVPGGMRHNVVNDSGTQPLKMNIVYAPPHFPPNQRRARRAGETVATVPL